jgi:uncharacterized protein YbjT (DUF2867 family)
MTILVTGSTGNIGSQVLAHLQGQGAEVRALTRTPEKARLPAGVTAVKGDLAEPDSLREALVGVSTMFLMVPNVADELTQAMLALNVARDVGLKGVVYLSVFGSEEYADVPHFTGKHAVERMIEQGHLPVTVLRPAYFIQNDARQKDALLKQGVYGMPVGHKGISMVDTRDIGAAAASELLRRERSAKPLDAEAYDLVGPDALTGEGLAAIWSEVLGRPIRYGGDDLDVLEKRMKAFDQGWHAYDIKLMFRRYQTDGAVASAAGLRRLEGLLGRPPRSYREFAKEAAEQWKVSG